MSDQMERAEIQYLAEKHQDLKPGKKKLSDAEQQKIIDLAEADLCGDGRYYLVTESVSYICDPDPEDNQNDYFVALRGEFGTLKDDPKDQDDEWEVEQDREFEVLIEVDGEEFLVASVDAT